MSALVLPVVRDPSCARGPPCVLFTAHLHMYNKSVLQYFRYIKNDDHHERTTNEIPFIIYRIQVQVPVPCTVSGQKYALRKFNDIVI
jgi:hypothetical protein